MGHFRISARIKPRQTGNPHGSKYLTNTGGIKQRFSRTTMTPMRRRAVFALLAARGDLHSTKVKKNKPRFAKVVTAALRRGK